MSSFEKNPAHLQNEFNEFLIASFIDFTVIFTLFPKCDPKTYMFVFDHHCNLGKIWKSFQLSCFYIL